MQHNPEHTPTKHIHSLVAVAVASLMAVTFSYAGEGHHKKEIKVDVGAGDAVVADVSDLEIGDSRQLYAGDKEVVITNTEDGLRIEVDGEVMDLGPLDGHHMEVHSTHGDGTHGDGHRVITSNHSKVIVKHLDGEAGEHGYHFISGDGEEVDFDFDIDVDGEQEWVSEDGDHHVVMIGGGHGGGEAAAVRLEASGVLDDLDDAKKQAILDALRSDADHEVKIEKKVIVIRQGADEEL